MADYIKREDVEAVVSHFIHSGAFSVADFIYAFGKIPSADVVERKKGKWIWDDDGMDWGIGAWRCSSCKARSPMWWNTERTNPRNKSGHCFCPNCGAEMEIG